MNDLQFEVSNTEGKKTNCKVIATYHDDDTNKDYIVYTDGALTDDNKLKLYYSLYESVNSGIKLIDVESLEDKKIGLQLIQEILKDLK